MLSHRNFRKDKNLAVDQVVEACHIWLENLKGKPLFSSTVHIGTTHMVIHHGLFFSTEGSGTTGPKDKLTVTSPLFYIFFPSEIMFRMSVFKERFSLSVEQFAL